MPGGRLDDENSARLALPKTYGVDDLPVMVQDVTFGFDDDRAFDLVGTDGGLLAAPASMNRVQLSPGERAEVVVTMRPGERTVLRSYPWLDGNGWERRFNGGDDSFDVLQLRAAERLRPSPEVPGRPAADRGLELPDADDAVRSRPFELRRSGINGQPMAMDRIDETVTRGTTEVWTLRNGGDMTHNFHVHDVQFRVLDVNGKRPEPALRGRKDTVAVPMGATVRIALRFDVPSDPDVPYMYHCHLGMRACPVDQDRRRGPGQDPPDMP